MGMWEDKGCWVWSLSMLRGRQYQIDTISCEKADSWGTLTCRGGLTKARDLTKKKKVRRCACGVGGHSGKWNHDAYQKKKPFWEERSSLHFQMLLRGLIILSIER